MREHDVSQTTMTWNGIDLTEGLAAGTELSETKDREPWNVKVRGRGGVIRTRNPGSSGMLTLNIDRESSTHLVLLQFAQADAASGKIVSNLLVKEGSLGFSTVYEDAFIKSTPDDIIAQEGAVLAWIFHYNAKKVSPIIALDANVVPG